MFTANGGKTEEEITAILDSLEFKADFGEEEDAPQGYIPERTDNRPAWRISQRTSALSLR